MARALKTHCKHGHEFTEENTATDHKGSRFCIACQNQRRDGRVLKGRETSEKKILVTCPACNRQRTVGYTTACRLKKSPGVCRSCSRRALRKGIKYTGKSCSRCGSHFFPRSGNVKYCDSCAITRVEYKAKKCPICGISFVGQANKTACSPSCLRRILKNKTYFGGRLFDAEGWESKTCQLCDKHVPRRYHVHHVYGHPDHSRLVILCPGCHDAISKLAARINFGDDKLQKLIYFVKAQRDGREPSQP